MVLNTVALCLFQERSAELVLELNTCHAHSTQSIGQPVIAAADDALVGHLEVRRSEAVPPLLHEVR
jgi:hypothetical protein